jgi:hypothetical protein
MFVDVACVNNTVEYDMDDQNYSNDMDPQAANLMIVTQPASILQSAVLMGLPRHLSLMASRW